LTEATGKRILIIDDEQLLLDLLEHLLVRLGYQVDPVLDVGEAFYKLENYNHDAIFLDMRMPLMGGKEFSLKIGEKFPLCPNGLCLSREILPIPRQPHSFKKRRTAIFRSRLPSKKSKTCW
jgi:CheY-like chemotaxis protein